MKNKKKKAKPVVQDIKCPCCGSQDQDADGEYSSNSWIRSIRCLVCGYEWQSEYVLTRLFFNEDPKEFRKREWKAQSKR